MATMKIELYEKPKKGAVVIEGFPGFGLIGTIATEFLIDHLNARQIGRIVSDKIPAIVAIHRGELVEPFAIFYNEKHNIVILRAIASIRGIEWELAEAVLKLRQDLKIKEVISIEGVGTKEGTIKGMPKAYYYTEDKSKKKRMEAIGLKPLGEGIIMGVTASLLSKLKGSAFVFAESYSELPDSRAAAKIIEVLDKYLNLKVDYKPLIEKADKFERKVRDLLIKGVEAAKVKAKKETAYVG